MCHCAITRTHFVYYNIFLFLEHCFVNRHRKPQIFMVYWHFRQRLRQQIEWNHRLFFNFCIFTCQASIMQFFKRVYFLWLCSQMICWILSFRAPCTKLAKKHAPKRFHLTRVIINFETPQFLSFALLTLTFKGRKWHHFRNFSFSTVPKPHKCWRTKIELFFKSR